MAETVECGHFPENALTDFLYFATIVLRSLSTIGVPTFRVLSSTMWKIETYRSAKFQTEF